MTLPKKGSDWNLANGGTLPVGGITPTFNWDTGLLTLTGVSAGTVNAEISVYNEDAGKRAYSSKAKFEKDAEGALVAGTGKIKKTTAILRFRTMAKTLISLTVLSLKSRSWN